MKKQLPSAGILSLLCASSIISCSIEDLEQDPASGAVGETAIHPVFQTFPATITALSPKPKTCLLRNSSLVAERTLTLTGIGFPFPRQTENIQFRREDTGAQSIHFGLEVVWSSSTQISVDIARIASLLWSDPKITLQVRITTYDPSFPQGQRPISNWSDAQVVLANDTTTCNFVNNTSTRPILSYYPLREPTQSISPYSMDLFQFAMYDISTYTSTEGRHPGMDFLDLTGVNQYRAGLQVAAAGDGTLVGYYDPSANPTGPAGQPAWVAGASPTDVAAGRAYIVIAHGNMVAVYAHLAPGLRFHRSYGARIHGGEVLGIVGAHENGDHLHQETRTYGMNGYNIQNSPLIFVNAWEYYGATLRAAINTNMSNRASVDGRVVPGWNGLLTPGAQRTQCFTVSGTRLNVYGYDPNGYQASWVEDNSLSSGPTVVSGPTPIASWRALCVP